MKKVFLLVLLGVTIFGLSGCGTLIKRPPEPLGDNKFQINIQGANGFTIPSKVTRDWNEQASKACGGKSYDVLSRQFTGSDQSGMEGIVKCKQ